MDDEEAGTSGIDLDQALAGERARHILEPLFGGHPVAARVLPRAVGAGFDLGLRKGVIVQDAFDPLELKIQRQRAGEPGIPGQLAQIHLQLALARRMNRVGLPVLTELDLGQLVERPAFAVHADRQAELELLRKVRPVHRRRLCEANAIAACGDRAHDLVLPRVRSPAHHDVARPRQRR